MSDSVTKYYEMQEEEHLTPQAPKPYTDEQLARKVCYIARSAPNLPASTVYQIAVDELLVSNVCDE